MGYTVEDLNGCTRKIIFNFDDVDLSKKIELSLKEKQKSANLKGFRQGKAPLSLVQQVYGPQIENDALHRFLSEEFYKAITEEKMSAVGYPTFANTKFEDGKKVSFEAVVEVFPSVEIKDYSKYSFKKENDSVTEEEVQQLRNRYLESKAEMSEVADENQKIEKGIFVVFNFEGEMEDGSRPQNMQAQEFVLEIGSGQFIPGFEEGMIGLKKGSKETINVTFPADYHETTLQNAPVKFHVEVLELKSRKFPALTDELVKELGFDTVADYETKTKERLVNQKKREVQTKLQQEILEKLVADNQFDIPKALLDQQKKAVQEELSGNLKQQGFTEQMLGEYFKKWDLDVTTRAEFQVRSGLILDKLATEFKIEVTDADLDAKIDEMAASSGMEKEQLAGYYKGNEQISKNLRYAIREEKTFEKLISKMSVK